MRRGVDAVEEAGDGRVTDGQQFESQLGQLTQHAAGDDGVHATGAEPLTAEPHLGAPHRQAAQARELGTREELRARVVVLLDDVAEVRLPQRLASVPAAAEADRQAVEPGELRALGKLACLADVGHPDLGRAQVGHHARTHQVDQVGGAQSRVPKPPRAPGEQTEPRRPEMPRALLGAHQVQRFQPRDGGAAGEPRE